MYAVYVDRDSDTATVHLVICSDYLRRSLEHGKNQQWLAERFDTSLAALRAGREMVTQAVQCRRCMGLAG